MPTTIRHGTLRQGDTLEEDASGARYRVLSNLGGELLLQPLQSHDPMDFITLPFSELETWTIVRPFKRKGVKPMAKQPTPFSGSRPMPVPPKMTRAEWRKRDKTTVTLTRKELDHLAQLVTAGRSLIRDGRAISPKLKAAMSRLGLSTKGL